MQLRKDSGDSSERRVGGAEDAEARRLLERYRVVAVVGLSKDPGKPSHAVAGYLQAHGYRVLPVNPTITGEVLGEPVYPSLRDIPVPVELVDIFRPPPAVPAIVEDAIAIGAKAIWMQTGIVHQAAAKQARRAGLAVVMDACMMQAHRRFSGA